MRRGFIRPFSMMAAIVAAMGIVAGLGRGPVSEARAEVPRTAREDQWTQAETPRFVVYSNGGRTMAVAVAQKLERFAEVIRLSTQGLDTRPDRKLPVYAFKDHDSFLFYRRDASGRPESIGGYFMPTAEGGCIAFDTEAREEGRDVLFHEYAHALTHHSLRRTPVWLEEGLAEYFGASRLGRNFAETGVPVSQHVALLRRSGLLTLDAILGAVRGPGFHEGERASVIYAQSWALTHYLMWGMGDEGARFAAFLSRLAGGQPPRQAFDLAYEGVPRDGIESGLKDYVRLPRFGVMRREFSVPLESVPAEVRAMSREEVLLRLGELLSFRGLADDAIDHLSGALQVNELRPDAAALIGFVEEERGRPESADSAFALSTAGSPRSARCDQIIGRCLLARFIRNPPALEPDRTPELVARARVHLEKALEAEPGNAETLALLGKTYLSGMDDPTEGIRILTEAALALPGRADVLTDLVVLYARAGHRGAARRTLQRSLVPIADHENLDLARRAIAEADIREYLALVKAGDHDAADSLLAVARAEAKHPDVLRRLDEVSRAGAADRAVRLYNSGVDALNGERYAEARALFEQAREQTPDPELRRQAVARAADAGHLLEIEEAIALIRKGERTRADAILEAVLSTAPGDQVREYAERLRRTLRDAP